MGIAAAQPGVVKPLAEGCGPTSSNIVCINKYGAVMPYHFFRPFATSTNVTTYGDTSVPADPSFAQVKDADFLVFDKYRGLAALGPNPRYDFMFGPSDGVTSGIHEAPVYAPVQNKLFFSQLGPPEGVLPQLVIDLNVNPPTIANYTPDPPVYFPNGGAFRKGQIIFGTAGGIDTVGTGSQAGEQRTGIRSVDPATNKSTVLLNNYFGNYFNGLDDLTVHPVTGDIWFTDPFYGYLNNETDTPPQLPVASWRFVPETGAVYLADSTLTLPNGIAFSPDGRSLYICDTSSSSGNISAPVGDRRLPFNPGLPRTIYKWDVSADGTTISNKRAFYLSPDWIPDGLKVAQNGYVVTATGKGVDILDEHGIPLLRIQTNYTVQNIQWTGGANLKTFWLTGNGGVSKVEWELQGQRGARLNRTYPAKNSAVESWLITAQAISLLAHPSPRHSMILGNLKVMGEALKKYPSDFHPMPMFTDIGNEYGFRGLYYMDIYPFGEPLVFIIHPEVAAQVQNSSNFYRHPYATEFLGGIVGTKSIFTTQGAEWHQQRSWFASAFSMSQILALVPGMIEETLIFREILTRDAVSGDVFAMNDRAMRLTIDVIGRSVGNIRLNSQTQYSPIQDAFMHAIGWTAGQTAPLWKKILSPMMMSWYTSKLDRLLGKVIKERYASGADDGPTKTILDLALKGYQKDHGKLSATGYTADKDEQFMKIALDNAKTFFAGGHDTTSSLITYTYYYLSIHPEILERVRTEHDEVFGTTVEATIQRLQADPHMLNKLPLTQAAFREILRLHSAGFTIRKGAPGATVTFQGRTYPMENHMIAVLASSMGRDPELWNSPDPSITLQDFYPDRWLSPETCNMAAWQAFEKGPRNCIGQQLALVEAKVIMALTLRWFKFQAVFKEGGKGVTGIEGWGGQAYQELKLTAKPKDGIPMKVSLVDR
ncbi:hypothetical protein B7463_g859, partial [Scytalidium lignicola]